MNVFFEVLISLLVASTVIGCDKDEPPKVPSGAAARFAPADVTPPNSAPRDAAEEPEVAAWVNDEPVPLAELERRLQHVREHYRDQRKPFPPALEEAKRGHLLEQLIDRRLIAQHIAASDVVVPPGEVDRQLDREVDEVFGSREALLRHLRERQLTLDEYRAEIEQRLAERRLFQTDHDEEATAEALRELYEEVEGRPAAEERFHLTSLIAGRDADRERIVDQLDDLRSAEAFDRLAEADGVRRVELEWVDRSSMSDALAARVTAVEPPGVSAPVDTPTGFEVYWVSARETRTTERFDELRPMLERRWEAMQRAQMREELLRDLRASAEIRRPTP